MFPAEQNGDCYIVDRKAEILVSLDGVYDVTITADEPYNNRIYHNAELIECASVDGRYWFSFRELSPMELRLRELEETNQMLTDCMLEISEQIYS